MPAHWAGCSGPLPTGCGSGGVRVWGPVTNSTARALASCVCALWGRQEGARGGRLLPGCVASGVWRSPSPDCSPSGRAAVAHYSLAVGGGGLRAWGPVPNPTARALASWLCALWGPHEGARGGRLLPGCGASGVGRSPDPGCPPSGRAAGAHYSLAVGAGGRGRGDPSTTPQRALLQAGFARCGGRMRVPGGGASCLESGRPGSGALPPPTARLLGGLPRPTTHRLRVRGGAGVGTRHQPHSALSCELALRAVGAARGRPGGAPPAWMWGVQGRGLSHPQLPALWAGRGGRLPTGCGCGEVRAWGPVTNPTSRALACCGGGLRVPGAGASCLRVGRPGSGALPAPNARPLGGLPGPTTHWLWVRGGAGVGTRHQPHSASSLRAGFEPDGTRSCVLWGRLRVPGVGLLLPCCGVSGVRRSPTPTARPLGGLLGPTNHWLWVRGGAGVGARHQPHSACSCELALRAVGAARGRPGGAPPAWVWGFRGRALFHPQLSALWAGCRGPLPTGCGCGGVQAWGPVTIPTACALACCGGGLRLPGGGDSCLRVGRPGSGGLPPPTARPLSGLPGPTTHWLWVRGGAGVGTRHQPHSARSCVLWGRLEGARGGASCLSVRRSKWGALPSPTARPLGGLPGPTTHWLWVRGGAGVRTHPQPHSARSCELALRAVAAARGRPEGCLLPGCGASGVGRSPNPD